MGRNRRGNVCVINAVDCACLQASTHTHIHTFIWVSSTHIKRLLTCQYVCIHACWHIHTHMVGMGRACGETQGGKTVLFIETKKSKNKYTVHSFWNHTLKQYYVATNKRLSQLMRTPSNSCKLSMTLQVKEALFQTGPGWNPRRVCLIQDNQSSPLNDCQTSALPISPKPRVWFPRQISCYGHVLINLSVFDLEAPHRCQETDYS